MKNTRYFPDYQSAYIYYGGTDVPSTEIALVGDGSYIFVSSDNSYSGNTQYFDANTTNDVIVQNMTTSAYNMGVSYGYDYGYPLGYTAGTAYGEATTYPVAYAAGEAYGYTTGHTAGYTEGEAYGYTTGHTAGYTEGYSYGYSSGETAGIEAATVVPYNEEYLTLESLVANNTFSIIKQSWSDEKTWYWSKDKLNWTSFDDTTTINANANEKVYLYSTGALNSWYINASGNYNVSGNVMSLIYGQNFKNQTTLTGELVLANLFWEEKAEAHTLKSAINLVLPATSLTFRAYYGMFSGCSALEKAPMLPATNLGTQGQDMIFNLCTSLKYIPYVAASCTFNTGSSNVIIIAKTGTTVTGGTVYTYDQTTQSSLWSDDPEEFMLNVITNAILNA